MDAPPVQYVTTSDGYDIAYGVSGQGPPLVSMPAVFSHFQEQWRSESFRPRFEALAAAFRLIQYDCRGEGMSTRGLSDSLLLEHYERDLKAVLTKFEALPVILYAPMISGQVAIRYALRNPDRLRALILHQANLDDPLEGVRYLEGLAKESWENFLKIPAYNFYRMDPPGKALSMLRAAMDQADFLRQMRLAATSVRAVLSEVRVPTLVLAIQGAYGPRVTGEGEAKGIATLIPDASLVVMSAGDPLARVISDFVAGLPEAAPSSLAAGFLRETGLSSRELEVLRLLAAGRSNQQIAGELVISLNTVRRHVSNIFDKTGAANRTEASVYARDHGLA